jgi:hypothetical protein
MDYYSDIIDELLKTKYVNNLRTCAPVLNINNKQVMILESISDDVANLPMLDKLFVIKNDKISIKNEFANITHEKHTIKLPYGCELYQFDYINNTTEKIDNFCGFYQHKYDLYCCNLPAMTINIDNFQIMTIKNISRHFGYNITNLPPNLDKLIIYKDVYLTFTKNTKNIEHCDTFELKLPYGCELYQYDIYEGITSKVTDFCGFYGIFRGLIPEPFQRTG